MNLQDICNFVAKIWQSKKKLRPKLAKICHKLFQGHNISIRHQEMPSRASELTIKATRKAFPTFHTHIHEKFSSRKCKASGDEGGGGWMFWI